MTHFLPTGTLLVVMHVLASVQPRGARRASAAPRGCGRKTPGMGSITSTQLCGCWRVQELPTLTHRHMWTNRGDMQQITDLSARETVQTTGVVALIAAQTDALFTAGAAALESSLALASSEQRHRAASSEQRATVSLSV